MAYNETAFIRARKEALSKHLRVSAEGLVRKHGFAGLTMKSLAKEAGVSVGTLYRYFDDKSALAIAVFAHAGERELNALAAVVREDQSVAQRLVNTVHMFVTRAQAAPKMAWATIVEPVSPALEEQRLHYRHSFGRLYARLLDEGVANGELPTQNTRVSAAALTGCIAEALIGPLAQSSMDSTLSDEVATFVLRAVGAKPLGKRASDLPKPA